MGDVDRNSQILTEYVIIKTILRYLPMKSLNSASQVCKAWNEIAKLVKKTRNTIYTWGIEYPTGDVRSVNKVLNTMRSQPKVCITFLTDFGVLDFSPEGIAARALKNKDSPWEPSHGRCTEYEMLHHIRHQLPLQCLIVGGITPGVVLTQHEKLETLEIEQKHGVGMYVLPDLPNVMIEHFYLDKRHMKKVSAAIVSDTGSVEKVLNLRDVGSMKSLLILGSDAYKGSKCVEALCQYFCERTNNKIAIGGGYVDVIIHPAIPDYEHSFGIMGLSFSGANMKANSVIIPSDVNTAEEVEKIIVQLKQCHEPNSKSIGFMFACVARGMYVYGENNVESSIFRKHFPTVPLIGFFGNGEIGASNIGDCLCPTSPKKAKVSYTYSYATVFTVLTFPE